MQVRSALQEFGHNPAVGHRIFVNSQKNAQKRNIIAHIKVLVRLSSQQAHRQTVASRAGFRALDPAPRLGTKSQKAKLCLFMSDSVKKDLLNSYRRFLRPLVRILIRHGIAIGEFYEVVKAVYAEVAEESFDSPHIRQSQSRIAILTGLTRKEVSRLKATDFGRKVDEPKKDAHRVARVLDGWHQDEEFTGPYGVPLEVPFDSPKGPSFSELVRRYSGDMAPRAMLDELVRVNAALELEGGWVRVLSRAYIPQKLAPEALNRMARVVENFVNTLEVNLLKEKPGTGRFERVVLSDHALSVEQMEKFDALVRRRGQELLEEFDDWLSRQVVTDDDPRVLTGVGIYHFLEGSRADLEKFEPEAERDS